jgi:hypothetical protein
MKCIYNSIAIGRFGLFAALISKFQAQNNNSQCIYLKNEVESQDEALFKMARSAILRVCELRVCELRVCELRVCELRVCESASCESASCESASLRVASLRVASHSTGPQVIFLFNSLIV